MINYNAVPPPTMAAIGEQMLLTLLASETADFRMDVMGTGVWVDKGLGHDDLMDRQPATAAAGQAAD